MPEYMKISSSGIRIGKKASGLYSAVSIASADAFFLVIGKNAFRMGMDGTGRIPHRAAVLRTKGGPEFPAPRRLETMSHFHEPNF